jgi:SHS2 domain-containing protein
VTVDADGDWTGGLGGHAIAVEFSGPTLESSIARAVEGFAESVVDIHPSVAVGHRPFAVSAPTPSGLLLAVLEECLRSRRDGSVAVGLSDLVVDGEWLAAELDTVEADHPHVHSDLAPVISWHEVTLEPDAHGGWSGRIVAR